jgi:pimeloyl-ACP methyl ester carboxylesterase
VLLEDLPPVPGVRHRTVDIGGTALHVAEAGDGPPLVLVHGWPQHWWAWREVIPPLAERYRVIAPDLRGWGWSDAPPGDYDKPTFADDLLALLDAEGLDRVTMVAHDWGGYAAFLLALSHPERLERLLALDIPPPWGSRFHAGQLLLPVFASYQVAISTPGLGRRLLESGVLVPRIMRLGSGPGKEWTEAEVAAFTEPLREPARAGATIACYRTFLTRELPRQIRSPDRSDDLEVPTTLLMGGAGMLNRIANPRPGRNLRIETVPRCGHFIAEEAPHAVLAALA